ncbi:protein disulfide-isomerase (PDI) [Vairimorpha necatrix]|uniref:protein disulfide-isomerase n=1 Tax=Vairimorpha necatrix TaxID=6039 RepID=A0AAX4JAF2_9MICR
MKFAFFILTCLCERSVVLNVEDKRQFDNLKVNYDSNIENGKGQGILEDLKIDLSNEEDMKKFQTIISIPDVPEGMGEVSKVIETFETDEIEEMKKGERFFIIFFVDEKTALLPADHFDRTMKVFISSDKNLAKEMNTPYPGIYGFNPRDKVSYQFPLNEETIKTIGPIVSVDLIGTLSYQNLELYKATGLHSMYVFIKPEEMQSFYKNYKSEASKVKHLAKFCLIPYRGDKDQLSAFGLTEEDLPGILFINDGLKYPLKKCFENNIQSFIQDVLDKKIEPKYASQDEPVNNDELNLKIFTRNNIPKFRSDKTKDKLIVFSSPSCNFCIQLRPVLEELATISRTHFDNKIVIGTCDITMNDIDNFDISSVPKIYLVKAETDEVFAFDSKTRSADSIAKFIKTNGSFNIDMSTYLTQVNNETNKVGEIKDEKPNDSDKTNREL